MVRRKIAIALIVTLSAAFALLVFPAACKQVPDEVLNNNNQDNHQNDEEAAGDLARDAAAAWEQTPRTLERMRTSAGMFSRALDHPKVQTYENLWMAARTAAWLAEYGGDEVEREKYTRQGLTYANTALKQQPNGAEATFYHGVLAGFLGDLNHDYGLDAVKTIEEDMTKLIDADHDIAHGGPWRVMGVLQLRAPGPPVSIGSLRNGRKNLEKAVELAPDWPENQLYMAEAEFMWAEEKDKPDYKDKAVERLNKYLLGEGAKAPEGAETEFAEWQKKAKALLDEHSS
ncbi:MAG: hypothetical protein KDB82_04005 [Planctomycetes bacterium]|nr:hypothetical protein [Planctomycetota bacterium]